MDQVMDVMKVKHGDRFDFESLNDEHKRNILSFILDSLFEGGLDKAFYTIYPTLKKDKMETVQDLTEYYHFKEVEANGTD